MFIILKDDNTWFNSSLKLNKTDILHLIHPKSKSDYNLSQALKKEEIGTKSIKWPFATEYTERFVLGGKNH